jgi:UTP--glucose-1-phosphate uridylyltransferase
MSVTRAVITTAGYGSEFLPATIALPRELMVVVDRPIVQYLVEEAVASGIEDIVLVIRESGHAVIDHFDSSRALEVHLQTQRKMELLERVRSVAKLARFAFVRQTSKYPYGNAAPILAARAFLEPGKPFAYMFGDDLVHGRKPCLRQVVDLFEAHEPAAAIAVKTVPSSETHRFGITQIRPGTMPRELASIVEKPDSRTVSGSLAQLGRFVLSWEVVERLLHCEPSSGQEFYLTPVIDEICRERRVLVHEEEGTWYTTGDPLDFMKANVEYTLRDREHGAAFVEYLRGIRALLDT